jgi:V/A-type H+-transporting ATPase subunit C
VGGSGNLAYVVARVKARKRFLLKTEEYQKMMGMGIPAIARYIGESQYAREVNELGLRFSGADLVEYALYSNLARSYSEVLGFCRGDLRKGVEAYMKRWDVYNIKTAMRGRSYGEDPERLVHSFIPAGTLKKECIHALASAQDLDGVISTLRHTEYYEPLIAGMKKARHERVLPILENALDKYYYSSIFRDIKVRTRGDMAYLSFLKREIDIINLKNILLLKREGVDPSRITEYIIDGGDEVTGDRLSSILSLGFDDITPHLEVFSFWNGIKAYMQGARETLIPVERALEKFIAMSARSFSYREPLSILPVMDYLLHKKIEVDNIRIIVRGKEMGIPEERIKDMLILR